MASAKKTPLLGVTMGDPAGIGPEVILKAAAALAGKQDSPALVIIGDLDAMRETARRLRGNLPELCEWHAGEGCFDTARGLPVLKVGKLAPSSTRPGHPTRAGATAAFGYVCEGARMALRGELDGLVTAPINKEWLNRAGHHFPGHSELLAEIAGARRWRMMFVGRQLRVALVTVHVGLARVPRMLTRSTVFDTIRLLADHLRSQLSIARPRIVVLGFNPHAGENGLFGDEELKVIAPAVRRAQGVGIDASGPVAPDTAFISHRRNFGFDGAVAMYHDQGLIALKTLEFDHAVNLTLGLPFVRTSPDHGTAYDIAGSGAANASSMIAAVAYAARAARGHLPRSQRAA
jgi:4-hydroxythreonine-4-phosphate dehydrogenase